MNEINWNQFMLKNSNPQDAFETICRNLFLRTYKVSSHGFSSNYNQTGLETEPVLFEDKYYGFQCKFSESGNSTTLYKQVYDSLDKAVKLYPQLDVVIIYTNLDIKPNVSEKELEESKETNRIKIYKLGIENNIEIIWFLKPNFEQALNDVKNYDLYRSFFSPQDLRGLLSDALTHDDRTFLTSNQFIDLSLNGKKFSVIKEEILLQNISIITGSAGTGKSEILKNLYLQCENNFLLNINQVPSDNDVFIPIFIRMRECINGDLEGLLRNRLKDFDINIANSQNHYVYFFDGIDEISTLDFGNVIMCIMRLKNKESTKGFVLSSRTHTANLTTVLRNFKPENYKIDSLKNSDVIDYFSRLNNQEKEAKLQEIKDHNPTFFDDITDIFSVVLLSENIFQVNENTTKVDLIELNAKNLIENNRKYSLINLPESKMLSIERILGCVSELMQRTGNISVERLDLQNIVSEQFSNCSYVQVDEIIDFISELFFDSSYAEPYQKRYSYRHKRFFEFFLYRHIKDEFYKNPGILRELRLLSNQDFILNIFLIQELKNNTLNNNIQRVLTLRFLETYLGEEYLHNTNSAWFAPNSLRISGADSYLQSQELKEFLCTKPVDDLLDFIKNDPLSIRGFLTLDTYYSFIKQYHKINGVDIRTSVNEIYGLDEEWLKKAAQKDQRSFMYCKCVIDRVSITEVYDAIGVIEDVCINDLDHYRYNQNSSNIVVDFFELALDYFDDWLLSIINNISINHLEVLSYMLLRGQNLRHITKDEGLPPLAAAISNRINSCATEQYGIHTVVLYGVLTGKIIQETEIKERAKNVNIYHYETWRTNFELNNYVGVVLGEEFSPYHYDFKLGIALRQIVNDYYPSRKEEILPAFLQEVNKYNLVCKNPFSYNNAMFIGESIASLNINISEIKKFVIGLREYGSVVSTLQVLYAIMTNNTKLFKVIANPSLITSEYIKACQELSYYDYNSDLGFKYATMISHFDIMKADALFEIAINNSVFRPIFRKENIIDYHLVSCLIIAYNNCWFSNEELELLIRRVYIILKIAKDTLDSGAYSEFFKYLVEQCSPQLLDTFDGLNMESTNPERTIGWEELRSTVPKENISLDNLSDYYRCEVDGVNYSSISVWEELVGFELEHDSELTILYQTLEKNYFPGSEFIKMSHCFHIITAVLFSNAKTFPKAASFIMEHAGRLGLVNQIKASALMGDDRSGRQYVEMLLNLCEAIVYPSAEYKKKIELLNSQTDKIVNLVCNSKIVDWDEDSEKHIMYYMPDQRISVRWKQYEEHEPFNEDWATKHPDKKAYSTKYYIYQEEKIIKVFDMVWVDGYRALIPMPDITNKHIDRKSYRLACLVNDNIDNLNRYIISSGLIVD